MNPAALGTVILGLGLYISACGQLFGSGSSGTGCQDSALLGSWSDTGETISFAASCGFTSTICGANATASDATGTTGSVTLDGWSIGATSGCTAQSDRSCTYTISGSTLTLKCTPTGGGTYTRK